MFKKDKYISIKNKIIDCYKSYLSQIKNDEEKQVVIKICPKSFCILMQEMFSGLIVNKNGYFISYNDIKIPILVENMPDDIEIIIESRKSYEDRELEKIYSKFYSMFESWRWEI